jgi:hypothetical protein
VYRTRIRNVGKDVARRMSTHKALSLESLVRQLSLDMTDTEATGERVGRYRERESLDKGKGEKEPGTEGSLGVDSTTRVVSTRCMASVSRSWKYSRTSAM